MPLTEDRADEVDAAEFLGSDPSVMEDARQANLNLADQVRAFQNALFTEVESI